MQINHPERTKQDDSGQWWYLQNPKIGWWAKVFPKICPQCGVEFVGAYRAKSQASENCSRRCGILTSYKSTPKRLAGSKNYRWKGGRHVTRKGYVQIWSPDHPDVQGTKRIYVLEHRLVMEKMIGRYLQPNENVHHKNGTRDDNRPENLELWIKWQPPGARVGEVKHCPTCTCGVNH